METSEDIEGITITREGVVAWITINRPARRNALALATMTALADAFAQAGEDPNIWVVVVRGAGDEAFCAGADLKEADALAKAGRSYPHPMTGTSRNLFELVLETPKPTVAAINGTAVGAGCELALACDVRLMAAHARIGLPEAKRGMGANFGSVILPRVVARTIAFDLLYSGRAIDAAEAKDIGLVTRVFDSALFDESVATYVAEIAANAPLTLQRYKQMALKGWELPVHSALRLDAGPNPYASHDREEGVRAFLERRRPEWQAR